MSKKIGAFFITLGILCLLGAVGLIVYNSIEEKNSEKYASSLLDEFNDKMDESTHDNDLETEMKTIEIGGYESIGILSIPVLELEFPVLKDWDYKKLKKAPCLYYGTYYEKDFVIAAHNYKSQFGRLKELKANDLIIFKDVNGNIYCYEVVLIETLSKYATDEMVTSGFDLSLYTCTIGGSNRVTVRCNKIDNFK